MGRKSNLLKAKRTILKRWLKTSTCYHSSDSLINLSSLYLSIPFILCLPPNPHSLSITLTPSSLIYLAQPSLLFAITIYSRAPFSILLSNPTMLHPSSLCSSWVEVASQSHILSGDWFKVITLQYAVRSPHVRGLLVQSKIM